MLGMVDVLFVCTGNLCRSPSAALFLRQQLGDAGPEVTVHSAGTVRTGARTPRALLLEGRELGIDLADHLPRMVDPDMIRAADLVVGLTRQHLARDGDRRAVLVPEDLYVAGDRSAWGPRGPPWQARPRISTRG